MRRTRLPVVVGVAVAAAVVAAVAIVLATRGGSNGSSAAPPASTAMQTGGGGSAQPPGPVSVLHGVPQHGDVLGKASAPATLEVFEDPQCPFCQEWALGTFPTVVRDYVKTGKVKLLYQGVEIIGPNSIPGLRAIYAAGRQDKLWNLVEELYTRQGKENSGWITTPLLKDAAAAAGADPQAVIAQSSSAAITARLQQAAAAFQAAGAQGTPAFVVERPPAVPQLLQLSALDPASFAAALDAALA
jgi:protein-disulfide isomerase